MSGSGLLTTYIAACIFFICFHFYRKKQDEGKDKVPEKPGGQSAGSDLCVSEYCGESREYPEPETPQQETKDVVILDTETTGLDEQAEIVEISVIDGRGNVLLDTLVRPSEPMPPDGEAVRIHGITNDMLADAPQWPQVLPKLLEIAKGKLVIIYNADYDTRLIRQTCGKYGLPMPDLQVSCAMLYYSDWLGNSRWQSLAKAVEFTGGSFEGTPHRALTDCKAVRSVLLAIQDSPTPDALRLAVMEKKLVQSERASEVLKARLSACLRLMVKHGLDEPPPDPLPSEPWEGTIGDGTEYTVPELPQVISFAADVRIEYTDSEWNDSGREITVREFAQDAAVGGIYAYCHIRQEMRTFMYRRVRRFTDLAGGEEVPPAQIAAWLLEKYLASPQGCVEYAVAKCLPILRILVTVARADGRMVASERKPILACLHEWGGLPPEFAAEAEEKIKKRIEKVDDINAFCDLLREAAERWPDRRQELYEAVKAVADADRKTTAEEQERVDWAEKILVRAKSGESV